MSTRKRGARVTRVRGTRGSPATAASTKRLKGLTLDAGALIAFERNDRETVALLSRALAHRLRLAVPAAVLAYAWRDGSREARLASFVAAPEVDVVNLDGVVARGVGRLLGARRTNDVAGASVAICARLRDHAVVTSDSEDIARLDPGLRIIEV